MINVEAINSDTIADLFKATTIYYEVDTSENDVTVTLNSVAAQTGQEYIFRHKTSGNTLTVLGADSADIDGSGTYTSTSAGDFIWIISNGSEWVIMSDSRDVGTTSSLSFETGSTRQGSTASILSIPDVLGNEALEIGSYTDSDKYVENNILSPAGERSNYEVYISNDFDDGDGYRTLRKELIGGDGFFDTSYSVYGRTDSDVEAFGGQFTLGFNCGANNSSIGLNAQGPGGLSDRARFFVWGSDRSYLDHTESRFVWEKGFVSNVHKMSLNKTGNLQLLEDVRGRQVIADGDNGGTAATNTLTNATDTPTTPYNWDGTGSAPTGYIKGYVGTQAVVIPYWST